MLLRNTAAVGVIMLGLMPFEISYERDSGMGGGQKVLAIFSNERAESTN